MSSTISQPTGPEFIDRSVHEICEGSFVFSCVKIDADIEMFTHTSVDAR